MNRRKSNLKSQSQLEPRHSCAAAQVSTQTAPLVATRPNMTRPSTAAEMAAAFPAEFFRQCALDVDLDIAMEKHMDTLARSDLAEMQILANEHNVAIKQNCGGRPASKKTTQLLRTIHSKRLESLVPPDRRASYDNPLYPSIDVIRLVGVHFSGYHEDAGSFSDEMQRLCHYGSTMSLPLTCSLI